MQIKVPGSDGSDSRSALGFIEHATRHLFFTGKGGVGKTSLSTATALTLADAGKQVLLARADGMLYEAKRSGRGRVVLSPSLDRTPP